jgi:hypothetical protein
VLRKLFKNIFNFLGNKDNRLLILFLIILAETLWLYFKGIMIEREIGRRPNYPLAFAEILTIFVYGLFYKVIEPVLEKKLPKIRQFLYQKISVPYLTAFVILIIIAVIFSMSKHTFFVTQISNLAYFMLVTGVAFEFFATIKENRKKSR